MIELQIRNYKVGSIDANFEEIKAELAERVEHYKSLAYSEDSARECKADHAKLKAMYNALDDERKRRKKEYMEPFEIFEGKIKELQGVINEPLKIIDTQLDAFEKTRRQKKLADVEAWWEDYKTSNPVPAIIQSITDIWNEKWMNATFTMKQIEAEVKERLAGIQNDIDVINGLALCSFEAMEAYKDGLDLRKALAEAQRQSELQAKKEAAKITAALVRGGQTAQNAENLTFEVKADTLSPEAKKAENELQSATESPKMWWVAFRAHLTAPQAHKLKAFFEAEGIEYEATAEK